MREIVGACLNRPPRDVRFRYGPQGKPELDGASVQFNVSHSRELALVAVALRHRLGIDVEFTAPGVAAGGLPERLLTEEDLALLRALPHEDQDSAFMAWWTRKESYVKALGAGLSLPLSSFSVSFLPGSIPRISDSRGENRITGWCPFAFDPAPRYAAALVVEGEGWTEAAGEEAVYLGGIRTPWCRILRTRTRPA